MADHIPFEIQTEIIKRLPVKSLIQFQSVSKQWKSLIRSSEFIAYHQTKVQHLLVRCENDDIVVDVLDYVSLVDDDTFPHQKVSVAIPLFFSALQNSRIIGSCHGLVCLYGDYQNHRGGRIFGTGRAVIWNPSIRKAVAVIVPNVIMYETVLGFGVCRETIDPKIVKITRIDSGRDEDIDCIPWQVEVFTLSTGAWRSPYSAILPSKSIRFGYFKVVKDGVFYWLATNRVDGFGSYNLIISFDMTSEEFREVNLPHSVAHSHCSLSMHKLRESLLVLESGLVANDKVFDVWMMEDGVSNSFTKLFTINTGDNKIIVRGFRNTGEPITEVGEDRQELAVYEPYSKCTNNIGVNGIDVSFKVYSYIETLLLVDQPDFTLYAKGKRYVAKPRAKAEGF